LLVEEFLAVVAEFWAAVHCNSSNSCGPYGDVVDNEGSVGQLVNTFVEQDM